MLKLTFTLNGTPTAIDIDPGDLLVNVLRDRLGLIGTKIGCGEGECGACTVLVDGVATLSCLYPAMKAAGRAVTTIEGLAGRHPVQEAYVEHFASQCGYCTPGFVMATVALLQENPHPTREEIMRGLSGNLCRCTGYYQIVDAVKDAAGRMQEAGGVKRDE